MILIKGGIFVQIINDNIIYEEGDIKFIDYKNIQRNYYRITRSGKIINPDNKILKTFISNSGYERANLSLGNSIQRKFSIHILVAVHFVYNDDPENKNQVNHKNGIKLDNIDTNLEWTTQSSNIIHAYDNDLCRIKGMKSHLSKPEIYTDEIVHEIASLLEKHLSINEIITTLKLVANPNIRSTSDYQRWRHYIKDLRNRTTRRDILRKYNF